MPRNVRAPRPANCARCTAAQKRVTEHITPARAEEGGAETVAGAGAEGEEAAPAEPSPAGEGEPAAAAPAEGGENAEEGAADVGEGGDEAGEEAPPAGTDPAAEEAAAAAAELEEEEAAAEARAEAESVAEGAPSAELDFSMLDIEGFDDDFAELASIWIPPPGYHHHRTPPAPDVAAPLTGVALAASLLGNARTSFMVPETSSALVQAARAVTPLPPPGPGDVAALSEAGLAAALAEAKEEKDMLMSVHVGLSRRMSASLATRPQTGIVDEVLAESADARYGESLRAWRTLKEECARLRESFAAQSRATAAELRHAQARAAEAAAAQTALQLETARASVFATNGAALGERLIRSTMKNLASKAAEVKVARLRHIRLRSRADALRKTLADREQLSEGLHLIDFEKQKADNAALTAKSSDRDAECARLRAKTAAALQARRGAALGLLLCWSPLHAFTAVGYWLPRCSRT